MSNKMNEYIKHENSDYLTAKSISLKITKLLKPFYPQSIIVPYERVLEVMNSVPYDSVEKMTDQVICIIVTNIKEDVLTEQRNEYLDNGSVLYGNKPDLRQHAPIKIRTRKSPINVFNMRF